MFDTNGATIALIAIFLLLTAGFCTFAAEFRKAAARKRAKTAKVLNALNSLK